MDNTQTNINHFKGLCSKFMLLLMYTIVFDVFLFWILYTVAVKIGVTKEIALIVVAALITGFVSIVSALFYIDTLCSGYEQRLKSHKVITNDETTKKPLQYVGEHPNAVSVHLRVLEAQEIERGARDLLETAQQTYPWLAQQVADYFFLVDSEIADELQNKEHPAVKAAKEVRKIASEKRQLQAKCKEQEYQLVYYETLFPWLEEFKTVPPILGAQYVQNSEAANGSEYDNIRQWLSPEEYAALSTAEKYQRALNRYKNRRKSDWEVGIEYERFVGYQYEAQGYKVDYHGALMGKQDMGRDLIAAKGNERLVIQCKRWASEKEIHENHIFQLYGSAVQLTVESGEKYTPVFITTTKLSEVAKKCADYLSVIAVENYAYEDYPMIKCNISSSGEKIYHLPFDQQYDRVRIIPGSGEVYASTVAEAEQLGFRRAFRWHEAENKIK